MCLLPPTCLLQHPTTCTPHFSIRVSWLLLRTQRATSVLSFSRTTFLFLDISSLTNPSSPSPICPPRNWCPLPWTSFSMSMISPLLFLELNLCMQAHPPLDATWHTRICADALASSYLDEYRTGDARPITCPTSAAALVPPAQAASSAPPASPTENAGAAAPSIPRE